MARITYNESVTFGGLILAEAVDHLIQAQQKLSRVKSLADSLSAGGASPALLEGSAEFGVKTGDGAAFYAAVADMKTNAGTVTASALADLDQGG